MLPSKLPTLDSESTISSPALWVDPQSVQRNIDQMISDVGGPAETNRLRPHIKTHKMVEVVEMMVDAGIIKCKVATPMEALIAAEGGARDILIAHQLVGPKLGQIKKLTEDWPGICFSAIVDNLDSLKEISTALGNVDRPFPLRIDINCGMDRSGIEFGDDLDKLRLAIESNEKVVFAGLHVYDGHITDPDLATRTQLTKEVILSIRNYLFDHQVPAICGGGSPTFRIWANLGDWECSPGTTFLWDQGYGSRFPDLNYQVAAGLLTRIISLPGGGNRICFDLGHKSIAAEMPLEQRVVFPEIPDAKLVSHSEEHLVVEVEDRSPYQVGQSFTAIPWHICPSVALHQRALVVENNAPTSDFWAVLRDRL